MTRAIVHSGSARIKCILVSCCPL